MKKLLIFLLIALSVSANAQKQRFFYLMTQGTGTPAAIRSHWTTPGAPSRVFKITGLNTSTTYTLKFLGSAADYLSGSSQLINITVAGGSGGGTLSNQQTDSNITNTIDFTCVPNGSGEITVTLANNATGVNYLNVLELSW